MFARVSVFFLLAASLLIPVSAEAQPFDHMRCFKIKDNAKFEAQASLTAMQQQFGIDESCQIKGKGKMFCVPVQKTVTDFFDKSKDGIAPVELNGQEQLFDSICYKIKCSKRELSPELVTDQFGSRNVEKFKSAMLCTPAIKGLPTTTSSTTTTTVPVTTTVPTCTPPTITDLVPPTVCETLLPLAVTVTGTGFGPDSVVIFDSGPLPTTFLSATELEFDLPIVSPNSYDVTVSNGPGCEDTLFGAVTVGGCALCDIHLQDCSAGQACYAETNVCGASACAAEGTGGPGDACVQDSDCAAGLGCLDAGLGGQCFVYCQDILDCPAGSSTCFPTNIGGAICNELKICI